MNANRMVIVVADSYGEDLAVIQVVASTQRTDQAFPGNLRCNRPCSVRGIGIATAGQHRRVSDELRDRIESPERSLGREGVAVYVPGVDTRGATDQRVTEIGVKVESIDVPAKIRSQV